MTRMVQTHTVDENILKDPAAFFEHPKDVLRSVTFSPAEKHTILLVWKEQAEALQRATGEGMDGGEPSQIESVTEALTLLEQQDETRH